MRALLVHNPAAGSGHPNREDLIRHLDAGGFSTHYVTLAGDVFEEAIDRGDVDLVVVAGGDGTVAATVRRLRDRSIPLAIFPTGTANNVAWSLGIADSIKDIAHSLYDAPHKRLDIGSTVGPWGRRNFLESVGWGALVDVVDIGVRELPLDQQVAAGRELFARILEDAEPGHVRVEVDGKRFEGDFIFVEILNIAMTGPRVIISPSAKPGDGLLDIVCLPAEHRQEMVDWLRSHVDDAPIPLTEIKARTARLTWSSGPLRIDDRVFDPPDEETEVFVEIEPAGLKVRVPPGLAD